MSSINEFCGQVGFLILQEILLCLLIKLLSIFNIEGLITNGNHKILCNHVKLDHLLLKTPTQANETALESSGCK